MVSRSTRALGAPQSCSWRLRAGAHYLSSYACKAGRTLNVSALSRRTVQGHKLGTSARPRVSPAFKPLTCSPSIEVASSATRLAKLLPTFHKDSGYCQRTPSCAISLTSTLSLVRHSYPTALSYLNIHLTPRNLLRHSYIAPVPSLMPKCSHLSTETHLQKVISHGRPEPWQEAQHGIVFACIIIILPLVQ